ncbi:PilW family protein [Faucicola mancuniensis]|uniref:PilW family protein n=1 Tax=Faucicola mancuniensis TaxID=1309795 RepID=UPI003977A600
MQFKTNNSQSGFTLIELMISLVLGMLIVAAVMQVYFSMVSTRLIQESGSQVTDVSVFGIQKLEEQLRIANLGNSVTTIDSETPMGGVVLTAKNLGVTTLPAGLVTSSTGDDTGAWTGTTGTTTTTNGSDQLTIQYTNVTGNKMIDCEGGDVANGDRVVERYFLRQPRTNPTGNAGLVLACDAGRMNSSNVITTPFNGDGNELILNVEQFKIMLGVQKTDGTMSYITPHQYKEPTNTLHNAPIVAVKVGMIVRSDKPLVGDVTPITELTLMGGVNRFAATPKYVRKSYESTTMLRNARLISIVVP